MLSKRIAHDLHNTQVIIVACAVLHNICIDMEDNLPNDNNNDDDDDNNNKGGNVEEDLTNVSTERQERDTLIKDHFADLLL